jgi:hypothetical protein
MIKTEYRLSIEELAYLMGALGEPDIAGGFLVVLLGELTPSETEGRLYAASHSLMARDLLHVDTTTGEQEICEPLADMVRGIVYHDFSLRCSYVETGIERSAAFFVSENRIVQHVLEQQVVSNIEFAPTLENAAERCAHLFGLKLVPQATSMAKPLGAIAPSLLDEASALDPTTSLQQMIDTFAGGGLSLPVAEEVADDIVHQHSRGSVLWTARPNEEQEVTQRGMLLLRGRERFWTMILDDEDPPMLTVYTDTAVFSDMIRKLLNI